MTEQWVTLNSGSCRSLRRVSPDVVPDWIETEAKLYESNLMPVVSMFYGIIVSMYFFDNQRHHKPHIHVRYQGDEAVFEIPSGDVLEGSLPKSRMKLVLAWIEIHQEELMADWELASNGQQIFRIDPLK